jgi:hypothetical protein
MGINGKQPDKNLSPPGGSVSHPKTQMKPEKMAQVVLQVPGSTNGIWAVKSAACRPKLKRMGDIEMANHYTNPLRKVTNRKIARNMLKTRIGSNRINESWRNIQIARYKKFISDINRLIHQKKLQRTLELNRQLHHTKGLIQKLAMGR